MAEKLYPLQLVKFEDRDRKAEGYDQALIGRYENGHTGENISLSLMLGIFGGMLVAWPISWLLASKSLLILLFCGAPISALVLFLTETDRRRTVKRFLQDPEAKYLYRLKQAAEAYNEQAAAYNEYLLVGEENMTPGTKDCMSQYRDILDAKREYLQEKIGVDANAQMPALKMMEIWRTTDELREAEQLLMLPPPASLPASTSQRPALPEPQEVSEALAELDAEFAGDKD